MAGDDLPVPPGERIRDQKRDVLELTERHAQSARNLDAWLRDTEEARQRGFRLGAWFVLLVSTILWGMIFLALRHWKVI